MITIYCNGKVHYRRADQRDTVVKEARRLIAAQIRLFGKSAYAIDWGEELKINKGMEEEG